MTTAMGTGPVRVGITGVGSYLPERVLTDGDLHRRLTAGSVALPEGLVRRVTGITRRREAGPGVYASTLAVAAGRRALASAGADPADVDLLLFASASRDMLEPATAHVVQAQLGTRGYALDVTNACNSFVNGIDVARAMILAGRARRALVVTGETPMRAVRAPSGRHAFRAEFAGYTFGDAGAAVLVEPVDRGGITDVDCATRSEHWEAGGIPGGGSRHPRGDEYTYFRGDAGRLREVFEETGGELLKRVLARTGLGWADFARVLVHQVTVPYLERFAEVAGVPREKLVVTVPVLGNVASATLGVQLDRVYGGLAPGERVLMVGLGGGISVMTLVWERS